MKGAFTEILGIVFALTGSVMLTIACYQLAGKWLAVIPWCLAAIWIGLNMATRTPAPGGTAGGTGPVPQYVDPDAGLPVDTFQRDRKRD